MKITSIRIRKNNKNNDGVLGVASIQLDNCLVIHGIKIIEYNGEKGLSFPSKKTKKYIMEDGEYITKNTYTDIVHPSNAEFRQYLLNEILEIYNKDENTEVAG